jgi:hypothetical protein
MMDFDELTTLEWGLLELSIVLTLWGTWRMCRWLVRAAVSDKG